MTGPTVRHQDIVQEGERVALVAERSGIGLRLLGGIAICVTCRAKSSLPELKRSYNDIDFAASSRAKKEVAALFATEGYEPNNRFNALHGNRRLLFFDTAYERQVDVFLGSFEMCHKLDLEPRLTMAGPALPVSDLLLLKLQIVELNHKDVSDALTILLAHDPIAEDRYDAVSREYIASVTAGDWGWYTTLLDNLTAVREHASDTLHSPQDVATVQQRIDVLLASMSEAPKSLAWRLRSKIGRRKAWYQLPEEVAR